MPSRTPSASIFALLISALPGQADGFQLIADPAGQVRIQLPASWKVERKKFFAVTDERKIADVIDLRMDKGDLWVAVGQPVYRDPVMQAWSELYHEVSLGRVIKHAFVAKPVPHLILVDKARPKVQRVMAFRRERGRGLHFILYCSPRVWSAMRPAFFTMVRSAVVNYSAWPPAIDGYKTQDYKGVVIAAKPSLRKSILASVKTEISRALKSWEKIHGPRTQNENLPLTVIVHADRMEHVIYRDIPANPTLIVGRPFQNRVFVSSLGPKRSEVRAVLAHELCTAFLAHAFGRTPDWLSNGETAIARHRVRTGRPLPFVRASFVGSAKVTETFEKMHAGKLNPRVRSYHETLYVMMFHAGPTKYRKAYRSFLDELRKTFDFRKATETHLLALDQADLLAAVKAFEKSLRRVKE